MAFTQKALTATFSYGGAGSSPGQTSGSGPYTTPNGLRVSARIVLPGGQDYGTMNLAIYGMTISHMNALTILPFGLTSVGNNTVTLMAGDNTGALSVVFKGTVRSAFADLHEQPEGCFRIQAYGAMYEKVAAAPAFSAAGRTSDVATVVQQLSTAAGFKFENSGVNVKLQRVNLPGSYMQQIAAICQHAGVQWTYDNDTVAIYPAGQARNLPSSTISPSTGMVGYPSFTSSGIVVTTLYQPTIKFGTTINVQSGLPQASGTWFIYYLEHQLDANIPNGLWFSVLQAGKVQSQQDNTGG